MRSSSVKQATNSLNPRKIFKKLFHLAKNHLELKLPKGSRMNAAINDSFSLSAMRILVEETNLLGYDRNSPFLIHLVQSLTDAFRKADINNESELKVCMRNILILAYETLSCNSDQMDQEIQLPKSVVGNKRKCDSRSISNEGGVPAKRSKLRPVENTLFSKQRKVKAQRDSVAKEAQDTSVQNGCL